MYNRQLKSKESKDPLTKRRTPTFKILINGDVHKSKVWRDAHAHTLFILYHEIPTRRRGWTVVSSGLSVLIDKNVYIAFAPKVVEQVSQVVFARKDGRSPKHVVVQQAPQV